MTNQPPFLALGGPPATPGVVHLVGAGPGDVGQLTLRAAQVLSTCDVVAYDRLAPAEALALVPDHADLIDVGRRYGDPGVGRDEVDTLLRERAAAGHAVVRLKGGDPFVFGRGGEEAAACAAEGIPVEVVPGVTSAVAVPGAAGIPVTHRGVATGFAVVTVHEDPTKHAAQIDHQALAAFPGTLVFLMGLRRVAPVCEQLIAHGRDPGTPAAVVSAGTTPRQRTVRATLATLADAVAAADLQPPAIIVVGDVAALPDLVGREVRPLHGLRVGLPRTRRRGSDLAAHLRSVGADVVEVPLAREEPGDVAAIGRAAADLLAGRVDEVVVLDAAGLEVVLAAAVDLGGDARALAGVRLTVVGRRTAAQVRRDLHLAADVTVGSAGELADLPDAAPDRRVLVLGPDADLRTRDLLPDATAVTTSRLRPQPVPDVHVDVWLVPASRLVPLLAEAYSDPRVPLVSMGPVTSAALRDAGLEVAAEAAAATPVAVEDALTSLLRRDGGSGWTASPAED
ncbi:uroporphyrinogen-III C-methyltransferase [Nitriliruptor alkaliphilus]|uniref:uroporphyrinogen-III C-methyltransferase n=1 Tax=Nitriliruptor alkaliphilus TaxID=427918 RepID=UPI00069651F1|nr:uroporphyrinogen-III C-methyltransferase [Nitriliruptor alkaliphilus]